MHTCSCHVGVLFIVVLVGCALSVQSVHFQIPITKIDTSAGSNVTVDLSGIWNVTNSNGTVRTTGTVPGNIFTDLWHANIIGDPYYGWNDMLQQWVYMDSWTYQKTFALTTDVTSNKLVRLECDGLDTVAQVILNGVTLGNTNNQFLQYIFDITGIAKPGSNSLEIRFTSAVTYANAQAAAYPYAVPSTVYPPLQTPNRNFIRKEQCSFAWDWGPMFAPQGIWMPIRIVSVSNAVLDQATVQIFPTSIPPTSFVVKVDAYITASIANSATVSAVVAGVTGSTPAMLLVGSNHFTFNLTVENPNLWWPNGYGDHPLYSLTVNLNIGNTIVSQIVKNVGFRSVEIVQDPMQDGGLSFYFRINGVPVFVKGANWIPADAFESRVTDAVIEDILQSAVEANMNTVRNWGGGIYQHDSFYSIADSLGLMVWQEFMFACSMYPRDADFLANVAAEVDYQIKRLSHHVSIILWSGNNENEVALGGWYPEVQKNPFLYAVDYSVLYLDTITPVVAAADPSRPFWPSSPSNGIISESPLVGRWGDPASLLYGDLHYYNYNADCTNESILPTPRFASEYGFQASPSIFAWMQVTEPANFQFNGTFINHREHGSGGVDTQLLGQMSMHFNLPKNINDPNEFENYIYLSQCVQALCIKSESEHYRRGKGEEQRTMGAIYWQLNDIWQAQTWSSLEYGGRWKLLHYYAKNFFAPFLVSSYENPTDTYVVYATSDINKPLVGKVAVSLWSYVGKQLNTWTVPFNLSSLGSASIFTSSISSMINGRCAQRNQCFFALSAIDQTGATISKNVFYLSSLTQVVLPKTSISLTNFTQISASQVLFQVQSNQVAPYVFLQTQLSGVFSDNGFVLLPNTPVSVQFNGNQPTTMSSLQNSITTKTVSDTY